MNRLADTFAQLKASSRAGLIPFITAGDPEPAWTEALMHQLVSSGADIIELGIPFSDPMADGPVIQASSERAIEKNVSLESILQSVATFRKTDQKTPIVLMGYMNPIERMGYEKFSKRAQSSGVDGVLLVDCPPEEGQALKTALKSNEISGIYLVAPTTTNDRIQYIAAEANGFIYYVALKGVTGAKSLDTGGLSAQIDRIRAASHLPVACGFGIKDAETALQVAKDADAVVIGSALVEALAGAESVDDLCTRVDRFLKPISRALVAYNER